MKILPYLGLSLLLLSAGCKSADMFGGLMRDDRDQASTFATDAASQAAGLPPASQNRPSPVNVDQEVRLGQSEISSWYQDRIPSRLEAARGHFEAALRQDAVNVNAHHGLAIVADLQNRFAEAAVHYRQALALNPNSSQILGDFGYSYLLQDKLNESERLLQQALAKDPNNANAIKHLGDVYARQGKMELAESTYRKVLNDSEVKRALAENSSQQPRADVAQTDSTRTRPLLDRLRPNPNRSESFTAQVQQERDPARTDSPMRRSPSTSMGVDTAATGADGRPAWAVEQAQATYVPPASGAAVPSEADLLKQRLAQIDREPTQGISQGPLIIDGPRPGPAPSAAAEAPVPWPGNSASMGAGQPQTAPASRSSVPLYGAQMASNSTASAVGDGSPPAWALKEATPEQNTGGTDPVTRPWGSVAPNAALASAVGNPSESVDQAYYEQSNEFPSSSREGSFMQSESAAQGPMGTHHGQVHASQQGSQSPAATNQTAANSYEEAARAAARLGMGLGGGTIFAVPQQSTPRTSPGSASVWNGAGFPPPARALPTDVHTGGLNRAYQPQATNMAPTSGTHGQYPVAAPPLRNADQFGTDRWNSGGDPTGYSANVPPPSSLEQYDAQRRMADGQLNAAMNQAWGDSPSNNVTPAHAVVPVQNTTVTPPPWPYRAGGNYLSPSDSAAQNRSAGLRSAEPPPATYPPGVVVPAPYGSSPGTGSGGDAFGRVAPTSRPSQVETASGTRQPAGADASSAGSADPYGLPQIVPGR